MSPRLVLLSDHSQHGQLLAKVLGERGIVLEAIVWASEPSKNLKKGGRVAMAVSRARRWLGFIRFHRHFYSFLKTRVVFVDGTNSRTTQKVLQQLAPDYILVGTGSILKEPIIATARSGVLNVHPALLPWVRGSGVVGHSLELGIPVGATLHYIDAGIDTGAIIERRLLPLSEPPTTLTNLEKAAAILAAQLMADVVQNIVQSGQKPEAAAQNGRFPLCRWPNPEGRRRLHELAQTGRAYELLNRWKPFTSGAPRWELPSELMTAPVSPPSGKV